MNDFHSPFSLAWRRFHRDHWRVHRSPQAQRRRFLGELLEPRWVLTSEPIEGLFEPPVFEPWDASSLQVVILRGSEFDGGMGPMLPPSVLFERGAPDPFAPLQGSDSKPSADSQLDPFNPTTAVSATGFASEAGPRFSIQDGARAGGEGQFAPYTFRDNYRWSSTAFSGSGLGQGDTTVISWGIVPDGLTIPGFNGEPESASNLRAFLGGIYGVTTNHADLTDEPWFALFQDFFHRWGQVSGVEYRYEPNDDNAAFGSASPGIAHVRADIRIGGHYIDGETGSNTLAYNFYPNVGDLVIDTSNMTFYANTANHSRSLRNVLSHEHGHGLGIEHVCPVISTSDGRLMEPFINLNFDGPQFDDILAVQRGYGDVFEKGLGNNTAARAVALGAVNAATPIIRGADGRDHRVAPTETDFLSIDDDADIDFFSFTVGAGLAVNATLTPVGPSYLSGPQNADGSCSAGTLFHASTQSDLALAILAADGTTVLHTAHSQGLGVAETLSTLLLPAGTYYARVTGTANAAQMYELNLSAVARGGLFFQETGGATAVAERGLTDSYELFLGTQPAGAVQVAISPGTQLEVSLDGTTFGSTAAVTFTNTTPVTVHVRAINDILSEGDHSTTIVHTITATNDPTDYPLSTSAAPLTVSIADNELAPFTRLTPEGSYLAESIPNTGTLQHASDQADYLVALAAGETLSAIATPDQSARLTLAIIDSSVTRTATAAGTVAVLPLFVASTTGTYTLRVTSDTATSFSLRATRNALLEQLLGDTTTDVKLDLANSVLNLGGNRYAVIGYSQPILYTGPVFVPSQNPAAFVDLRSYGVTGFTLGDTEYANISGVTVGNSYFPAGDFSLGGNGGLIAGHGNYLPDTNTALPASTLAATSLALLPFWDDLNSGTVYVAQGTFNSIPTLIVQWQNRPHYDVAGEVTFQVQVFQSGPVHFRYVYPDVVFGNTAYDAGSSATVGYQVNSTTALQFSFHTASLSNGLVLDYTQPANVPDVDEYELDLSGRVGAAIDVLLNGLDGTDFSGQMLQLVAPDGTVAATAVVSPVQAGTTVTNYQLGILGFVVPTGGIYTLRLSSFVKDARYALVVTDQLRFDSEPNNTSSDPLRHLNNLPNAIGHLSVASDPQDRYLVHLTLNEPYLATTTTPFAVAENTSPQTLNPELSILAPDGSTVVASNQGGANDGLNARVSFIASQTGTYQIITQATSGSGEYRLSFSENQTVTVLALAADQATRPEGDSGSTAFTFTVTRTGMTSGTTSVHYAVTGTGATPASASDFADGQFPSGTISFAANETSKTISIPIRGDLLFENPEDFTVTLSSPSPDTEIVASTASGTIQNDDTEIIITEIMYDPNSPESVWEWVEIYNPGPSELNLAGWVLDDNNTDAITAAANISSGTIAPGSTAVLINASLSMANFALAWGHEINVIPVTQWSSLSLNNSGDRIGLWRNFTSYSGNHVSHLNSVTSVNFGSGSGWPTNNNGSSIYLTNLTLDPAQGNSWALSTSGTANAYRSTHAGGSGNTGNDIGSPGRLPGERSVRIDPILADRNEGQSGDTSFTFQIQRVGDTDTSSTIDYVVAGSGSNAANATDFGGSFPSGTVTFGDNVTSVTLAISVRGDLLLEPDEEFTVTLVNPPSSTQIVAGAGSAIGTIRNDDSRVSISANHASRHEGDSGTTLFTFDVLRTGNTSTAASVQWTVSGGALEPADAADFLGAAFPQGSVDFAINETTKIIEVPVQGDLDVEANESWIVTLANPSSGMQIGSATASGSILNDDVDLTIETTNADRGEGNDPATPTPFTFTIRRSGLLVGTTSVTYSVSGSGMNPADAADFGGVLPGDVITFSDSETVRVITIPVSGDSLTEPDETFTVTLSNPSGNAELVTDSATGTIRNDDTNLIIVATDADKMEGNFLTTPFTFTVTRSGNLTGQSTVNWSVTGNGTNPANAADFSGSVFPSGSLVFDDGVTTRTITVNVRGDENYEPDEGFRVTLANANNASLDIASADGVIQNDDTSVEIRPVLADRAEGNTGNTPFTFEVIRSGSTMSPLSLVWNVTGSGAQPANAADFGGSWPSGQIEFSGGESRKEIAVHVRGDLEVETDEGFTVTIRFEFGENASLIDADADGVIRNDDTGLSLQMVDSRKREGDDGYTPFQFRVVRTGLLTIHSSVDFTVSGSSAPSASAADFGGIFPNGSVSFTSGQSEQTISVNVSGDLDVEPDESFQITLSNAAGGQILVPTGSAFIVNDDIELAIEPILALRDEGNADTTPFTFRVTRSGDTSSPTSVHYAVTGSGTNAANAADFGGSFPAGIVTLGADSTMEILTILVSSDLLDEFDESFTVTLFSPSGSAQLVTASVEGFIRNDDAAPSVSISLEPSSLAENGGTGTITATISALSGKPITVELNFGGTATHHLDYTRSGDTITIAPGNLSGALTLTAIQDVLDEPDETITFFIQSATNVELPANPVLTAPIIDDDIPPSVTLSLEGSPFSENGGSATLTATLLAVSSNDVTVLLAFGGTATAVSDYTRSATSITIPAGSTSGMITLTAVQDALDETDETIIVKIDSVTNGIESGTQQVTATITDDDEPPTVMLSLSSSSLAEAAGTTTITASLSAVSGQAVTVQLAFIGTATQTTDYTVSATAITIPAGSTSGTLTLTAVQDTLDETNETIIVEIDSVTNGIESSMQQVTAMITDDDDLPTVTLALSGSPLAEADGTATVTALLSEVSGQAVTVQLTFSGTAAQTTDYTVSAASITIPAGNTSGTITLTAVQDALDEANETIVVDVLSVSNGTESGTQQVVATITDDDFPVVSIESVQADRSEGQNSPTSFTFVVRRSGQLNMTGSIGWSVSGSGTNPAQATDFDGSFPSGAVSFAIGESEQTVTINVSGDIMVEPDEQFQVTLVNPVSLQIGKATASGVIRNDDLSLEIAPLQAVRLEGNSGTTAFTFSVVRRGFAGHPVQVSFVVTGIGADAAQATDFANGDYPSGSIELAANETEKVLTIFVSADPILERDEDFRVTLANPTVGTLAISQADGRILNDDSLVLLIDDGDAQFQRTGHWTRWTVYGGYASADRTADMLETGQNSNSQAIYRFQNLQPGMPYSFAATWPAYSSRSTQAPYTISGIAGGPRTIYVNQQVAPNDFTERDRLGKSHWFETLGTFVADATGQVTITLSSATSGGVIADAIKLTSITTPKLELRRDHVRHPHHDTLQLGTVLQGGYLIENLRVINMGMQDLILQPVVTTNAVSLAGSGFTANQRLLPGESATLLVQLDVTPLGVRSGTVSITSNDPDVSPFVITLTATTVAALVVDDGDRNGYGSTGSWGHWAGFGGFAGDDRTDDVKETAANSGATASYTFAGLNPGATYQVSASWTPHPNRTTQAPYRISGIEGTSQTIFVNQRSAPVGTAQIDRRGVLVEFAMLGNFVVDSTGTLTVTLSAASAGNTIADAVRVVPLANVEVRRGTTTIFSAAPVSLGTRLRGEQVVETLKITNRGSENLVLQPATTSGQVSIFGANLAPSQTLAPGASQDLQVVINTGVSGHSNGVVTIPSNDPILPTFLIPISATVVDGIFIDDGDLSGFQLDGRWSTWVGYGGFAGGNMVGDVRETRAGTGATATYRFTGLTPGSSYQLAATWTPHANRTTQAPYRIQGSTGGSPTVLVNQQLRPQGLSFPDQRGTATPFQSLGNFTVDAAGTLTVILGSATTGNVIADAVRISLVSSARTRLASSWRQEPLQLAADRESRNPLQVRLAGDSSQQDVENSTARQPTDVPWQTAVKPHPTAAQLVHAQVELAMQERWLLTLAEFMSRKALSLAPVPWGFELAEGSIPSLHADQPSGEASFASDPLFLKSTVDRELALISTAHAPQRSKASLDKDIAAVVAPTTIPETVSGSVRVDNHFLHSDSTVDPAAWNPDSRWLDLKSLYGIFSDPFRTQTSSQPTSRVQRELARQPRLGDIDFIPYSARKEHPSSHRDRLGLDRAQHEPDATSVEHQRCADLIFADWNEADWRN